MGRALAVLYVVAIAGFTPVFAGEAPAKENDKIEGKDSRLLWPIFAGGFSYPLIFSVSGGAMLPLFPPGKQDAAYNIPSVPALRAEAELGLGGASVSAGVYVPVVDGFGVNLKGSRMRTWLGGLDEKFDERTYDGVVAELVIDGHIPLKIGIGRFKDRDSNDSHHYRFTSFFIGIGW